MKRFLKLFIRNYTVDITYARKDLAKQCLWYVRYTITCTIINTFDSIKYIFFGLLLHNNFNIMIYINRLNRYSCLKIISQRKRKKIFFSFYSNFSVAVGNSFFYTLVISPVLLWEIPNRVGKETVTTRWLPLMKEKNDTRIEILGCSKVTVFLLWILVAIVGTAGRTLVVEIASISEASISLMTSKRCLFLIYAF